MDSVKILIVDDEPDILEFLKYNLVKEGYKVTTANDGAEGIKQAEAEVPSLIILDIMMPKMDGVEVCRHLRSRPEFDKTLIVFLTAREEDYSQIAALDVGGDDYITKPIRPRVFISRVKALLRRSERNENLQEENVIKVGGLTIDKEKVNVQKGDQVIDLAKKRIRITLSAGFQTRKSIFQRRNIQQSLGYRCDCRQPDY